MKINQLASKPQLIKLTIDDEEIVAEYGEAIEFWTLDRQPLDTFMKLATASQTDPTQIIDIVRKLILDENGKQVIDGDQILPTSVFLKIIKKIVETLGK